VEWSCPSVSLRSTPNSRSLRILSPLHSSVKLWRGDQLCNFRTFIETVLSSLLATCSCLQLMALNRGVSLSRSVLRVWSAPCSRRMFMIERSPTSAATCRAVRPLASVASIYAPCPSRRCTVFSNDSALARRSAVHSKPGAAPLE